MLPTPPGMFESTTLIRYAAGAYTNGRWAAGTATQSTIVASVQPATSDDLLRLDEGFRTAGGCVVYSQAELRTANEATGRSADRIVWNGENWEVQKVDGHGLGIIHYRAICTRVER